MTSDHAVIAVMEGVVILVLLVLLTCEKIESAKWKKLQKETQDKFVAEQTKRLAAWQMSYWWYERRKTDPDACIPFTREEARRDDGSYWDEDAWGQILADHRGLIGEPITENITFKAEQ